MSEPGAAYEERVQKALRDFGIPLDLVRRRRLELCEEAPSLVVAEVDGRGREQRLSPTAAEAWTAMKAAAARAGIALYLISAYRSFDRQCEIVREKLAAGLSIQEILGASAPPGYSEHHTGRAIDIGADPGDKLEEAFERSEAYAWLLANAGRYGFHLSYPRGNRHGYRYEPWHWLHRGADDARRGGARVS
jgi:D-alanyl-D-alanine carboxypeptidase